MSSAEALGSLEELVDDAAALSAKVARQLSSPGALLLPAPARECIRELAHVVTRLAVEVSRCPCKRSSPSK